MAMWRKMAKFSSPCPFAPDGGLQLFDQTNMGFFTQMALFAFNNCENQQ
jgi:hypothetical protein